MLLDISVASDTVDHSSDSNIFTGFIIPCWLSSPSPYVPFLLLYILSILADGFIVPQCLWWLIVCVNLTRSQDAQMSV